MDSTALHVKMLGGFSIRYNGQEINTSNSRSRKIWLLLAYLIYYRKRRISRDELLDLLWTRGGIEEDRVNPAGALKTTFHRARTLLNQLDESVGHTAISITDGEYAWNRDVNFSYDVEDFEKAVTIGETSDDDETRLTAYLRATELYQGDLLPSFSTEPWVMPISTYYHNTYIHAILNALPLLEKGGRLSEAVELCRRALKIAPDHERLYQHLMQDLLTMGDQKAVITVYNDMRELLLGSFGIMPSEEVRSIYQDALYTLNHQALDMEQVIAQLKEPDSSKGALFCDYDFFKTLYHAEARAASRNGTTVHICLLTMTEKNGKELTRRSLDRCMENLHGVIHDCLRKSDVAARCSVSQYILLLPRIRYKDCFPVCERLQQAFYRQYPHSPGELTFAVNPPELKEEP